jgi:hypothetical protein
LPRREPRHVSSDGRDIPVIDFASCPSDAAGRSGAADEGPSLAEILEKAAAYCELFENASLNYVCVEDVKVTTYIPYRSVFTTTLPRMSGEKRDRFIYDYQLIRTGGRTSERRKLLNRDGTPQNSPSAAPTPGSFAYQNIILGPMILSQDWQQYHDYEILGREKVAKEMCAIIQAIPKPSAPRGYLFGKVWVSERDGRILKLEWYQESIQNYEVFAATGKALEAKPRISLTMEYLAEKNGIGFPSRCRMTENYVTNARGIRLMASETTVNYERYKFFTVETEVRLDK